MRFKRGFKMYVKRKYVDTSLNICSGKTFETLLFVDPNIHKYFH